MGRVIKYWKSNVFFKQETHLYSSCHCHWQSPPFPCGIQITWPRPRDSQETIHACTGHNVKDNSWYWMRKSTCDWLKTQGDAMNLSAHEVQPLKPCLLPPVGDACVISSTTLGPILLKHTYHYLQQPQASPNSSKGWSLKNYNFKLKPLWFSCSSK